MKTIIYTTVSLQLNKITTNVLKFKKRSKIDREIDRIKFWSVDGTAAGSSPNQPGHFVSGCRLNGNHASRLSGERVRARASAIACARSFWICHPALLLEQAPIPDRSNQGWWKKSNRKERLERFPRSLLAFPRGNEDRIEGGGDLSRGIDLISLTTRVLLVDSRDLLNWSRFTFFDSRTALFFPFYDIYMYVYM